MAPNRILAKKSPDIESRSNSECDQCGSKSKGFFCQSPKESLSQVDKAKSLKKLKSGEVLFSEGDQLSGVYCVKSGHIKVESYGDQGQAHLLHVIGPGGVLGLRSILEGGRVEASASATEASEVCFIPQSIFKDLLLKEPVIAMQALKTVALDLHVMEKRFCSVTDHSAPERIAEALLHLKDRFEEKQWSRKEFAEWASTTTETVIRTLSQFEKEGLIRLDGRKIILLDRKRLLEKAKIFI